MGGHDFRSVARLVNLFQDRSRGQHPDLIIIRIFVHSGRPVARVEKEGIYWEQGKFVNTEYRCKNEIHKCLWELRTEEVIC